MLQEFLSTNRDLLIDRCKATAGTRRGLGTGGQELKYGIPLFLDQLINALRLDQASGAPEVGAAPGGGAEMEKRASASAIGWTAAQHGRELLRRGFTVSQVVHGYGDLCQAITDVAIERNAAVSPDEFRTLNRCLDDAIADAVTEFGRQRDEILSDATQGAANERLGFLAHELRNLIGTAILAVATIKLGHVGVAGATGGLLDRSLIGLRDLVDRALVDVRLTAGLPQRRERIVVRDFIEEVHVATTMDAAARDLEFTVAPIDADLAIEGDRQILAAAVANILQNAVKFTRPRSRVSLTAHAVADRVVIAIEDECGGLPEGKEEDIFRPFEQASATRTGIGLGLPISRRGVEAHRGTLEVRNLPGTGCVFTIDLPRAPATTS